MGKVYGNWVTDSYGGPEAGGRSRGASSEFKNEHESNESNECEEKLFVQ